MNIKELFTFRKSKVEDGQLTIEISCAITNLAEGLKNLSFTQEEILKTAKEGVLSGLQWELSNQVNKDELILKYVDLDKILKELAPEIEKAFTTPEFIESLVRQAEWKCKDKIIDSIDWTQITPALNALVTKQLADMVFSRTRL